MKEKRQTRRRENEREKERERERRMLNSEVHQLFSSMDEKEQQK